MSNIQPIEDEQATSTVDTDEDSKADDARRKKLRKGMLSILAVAAATALAFWLASGGSVSTDNAYIQADKIEMAAAVPGIVVRVQAKTNQPVRAGDVLFQIKDVRYRIAVAAAEAALAEATNRVNALKDSYVEKLERLSTADENVTFRKREFNRQQQLRKRGVVSETKLDEAQREYTIARQLRAGVREDIATIKAQLGGDPKIAAADHPTVLSAAAARNQARVDLANTIVTAPVDGIIARVNLQPGEIVAAGQPGFTLISSKSIWITANFKETDLTHVREGQKATITFDIYPDHEWSATVASISPATGSEFALIPAQNASGNWVKVVQRVPVRLDLESQPNAPILRAGLSAIVEIDTEHPNALSRWLDSVFGG